MKRKLFLLLCALLTMIGVQQVKAYQTPEANGIYYVYNTGVTDGSKGFISRGEDYSKRAVISPLGVPIQLISAGEDDTYYFQFYDTGGWLSDDGFMYTDGGLDGQSETRRRKIKVELQSDGKYKLLNKNNDKEVENWYGHPVGDGTGNRRNYLWQFLSASEYEAVVAGYALEQDLAVASSAGWSLDAQTVEGFKNYIATNCVEEDKTSCIKKASFDTGHETSDWTITPNASSTFSIGWGNEGGDKKTPEIYQEPKNKKDVAIGGTISQVVTVPNAGVYKVSVNAFYRSNKYSDLHNAGITGSVAYLQANSNRIRVGDIYSTLDDEETLPSGPNNANNNFFANGKYLNEVYVYVPEESKTITITLGVPSYTPTGWFVFNNFKLTRYSDEISAHATSFTGGVATKDTWYAFNVDETSVYQVSSSEAATITYSQDGTKSILSNDFSSKTLSASGSSLLALNAGKYYFKCSASSTIAFEKLETSVDVTNSFITNPSFETGDLEGWTNPDDAKFSRKNGTDLANKHETWYAFVNNNRTKSLAQTISHLPEGKYILSVNARLAISGENIGTATIGMGGNTTFIPNGRDADTYTVAYEAAEDASAAISYNKTGAYTYHYFDKFTLTYYTEFPDVDGVDDLLDEIMGADERAALNAANTAYTDGKTAANYNALQNAIVNAKVSIAEYAAKTGADADWTGIIRNPSFEPNDYRTGWTVNVSSGSSTGETVRSKDGGLGEGGGSKRFFIWTSNAGAATVSQTIKNLPEGNYKLSAYLESPAGSSFTLKAGSTSNTVTTVDGNATPIEVYFTQASAGDVEIRLTNTASWFDLDNFRLTKEPSWPELTAAEGTMNSTVASNQTSAISTYNDDKNLANLNAALNAIAEAKASIYNYTEAQKILNAASALDADGRASYAANETVTAIQSAYNALTLEAVTTEQRTICNGAYITAVKAQTTPGSDMTEAITNPSFESATSVSTSIAGWTNEANKTLQTQSNTGWAKVGSYYAERWHSTGEKHIHQTVTGLHAGAYVLTAKAYASNVTSAKVYVKVGETESAIDVAATNDYSVLFNYDGTSELKIGFFSNMSEDGSDNWICIDNFRLTYAGAEQTDLPLYTSELMYATVKENANTAIRAYNENKTSANYTAAQSAIATAEASKMAYARISGDDITAYRTKIGAVLAKTNVYTTEAYNKWYANVQSNFDKGVYTNEEAETLTDGGAYTLPSTGVNPWHWNNRIDDVLLSSWTIGGEQCKDYDKALYINNWSVEGNTDGSGFQAPFFEYWTEDANSLGATTLQATVSDLDASTEYTVNIWARVRQTNDQTKVAGKIMLQVGSGSAVDIASGNQVGSTPFYLNHFTATGSTDAEGVLTITISVAASSNVSWLSFKDVAVSKQSTSGDEKTYSGLINNDTELVPTTTAPIVDITAATFNGNLTADFSSNANGFIIATAAQKAALSSVNNVIVNGTCDNLVLTDGVSVTIPAVLTEATSASYSRTISPTSNFGTICLPFNVKSDENIQFYTVSEITGENVLNLLTTDEVAAGTPAIFKKKTAEATNVEVVTTDATVTNVEGVQAATNVQLIGAYSPIMVGANDGQEKASDSYYISANKFYQGKNYFYIDPFRAYLKTVVPSGARLAIRIDGETAIEAIEAIEAEAAALKDGKYIIDNKVVIVKNGIKYSTNGQKLN